MQKPGQQSQQKQAPQKQPPQKQQEGKQQFVKPSAALYPICPNKGVSTRGRKKTIEVNYLKLNIARLVATAYHYDIAITPDKPKRLFQKVFTKFRQTNFPNVHMAFDGQKNAYSPAVLNFCVPIQSETKVTDPEDGREKTFMVQIQEVRGSAIDLSALRINFKPFQLHSITSV